MPKFAVVLAAAGQSSRFTSATRSEFELGDSSHLKKVFRELNGRAVWLRSAAAFIDRPDVSQVLIVLAKDDVEWFKDKYRANLAFLKIDIVEGGAERADSVQNALSQINPDVEYVAIHDAARPVLADEWISDIFAAAVEYGAAILGIPVSSTLKRVADQEIEETVPRADLFQAQTPQVFERSVIQEAYAKREGQVPTDDSQLVEQTGHRVHVVPGSALNIKITTQEDLKLAAAMLDLLPQGNTRSGLNAPAEEKSNWLF
jgi:2-C-methyl-D-erythritol 4-phosphate cytidylyltransferase